MPRITVGIRLRPDSGQERKLENLNVISDSNTLEFSVTGTLHSFTFDNLFPDTTTQQDIFNSCAGTILDNALDGYNGCIFAYGQTGAGKTYTMSGSIEGSENGYGLSARVAKYLFMKAKSISDHISFRISILEIYNETLLDLLAENQTNASKLNVIETEGGVIVPGLHIIPVDSADDTINLLVEAQANRSVAEHQLNQKSSRSHVIYTYYITRTATLKSSSSEDPIVHQSKLHLVDLAGSERVNKTLSTGSVQKEANYINRSLSYLEQVVIALGQTNREHIPFRQSKLTYLLKDSLGGNCNTYMIACIWPRRDHSWESLSTLRFAARMKAIETHPVRNRLVAKEQAPSRVIQQQLELLKKELVMRDMIHGKEPWIPEMTKQQKFITYKQCLEHSLSAQEDSQSSQLVEINSLSQAYLMIDLMTQAFQLACSQNNDRMKEIMQQLYTSRNEIPPTKLTKLFQQYQSDSNLTQEENEEENVQAQNYQSTPKNPRNPTLMDNDMSEQNKEYWFQMFIAQGEVGYDFNQSYEVAKDTLKDNKTRQREIITLLNDQKALIDDLSNQMTTAIEENPEIPNNTNNSKIIEKEENIQQIQFKLENAKKSYRVAHQELQICKEQISETQSLKKRALAAMMNAFNEYLSYKIPSNTG